MVYVENREHKTAKHKTANTKLRNTKPRNIKPRRRKNSETRNIEEKSRVLIQETTLNLKPMFMLKLRIILTLPRPVHSLCKFDEVTTAEVERLLSDSSTKQCELDSAPVWLLKSLCMVFAPILALLIDVSI